MLTNFHKDSIIKVPKINVINPKTVPGRPAPEFQVKHKKIVNFHMKSFIS